MTKYVLVSQGIKIYETYNKQEAEDYIERENAEWYKYCEQCAENNEPRANNEVFLEEEEIEVSENE